MSAELAPDLAPDILQDMKVVELNVGLWINRLGVDPSLRLESIG
jgi:hypothetical protein